jgi:hypothetical protein
MHKFAATACLAFLMLGCDLVNREEPLYEGRTYDDWIQLSDVNQNEDVSLRTKAVRILGELGPYEPDLMIPALAKVTTDPIPNIRLMALKELETLAPKAKKAQPAVGRAMSDKDKHVAKQAMKTYKAIEMAKPSALTGN